MGPSVAELSIKHIGIVLAAYMIFLNSLGVRQTSRQKLLGGAAAVMIGTLTGCVYNIFPVGCIIVALSLFCGMMVAIHKLSKSNALTLTIASFGISYILWFLALAVLIFFLYLNKQYVSDRFERSVDAWIYVTKFVTNFRGGIIARSFIFAVQFCLLLVLLRPKWTKDKLNALLRVERNDVLVFFCAFVLTLRVLWITSVFYRSDIGAVMIIVGFVMILLFLLTYFWLKKEYRLSYNIALRENELQLLEKSLDGQKAYFKNLSAVNERLGKLIHRDNKLIPSVVMSVRQSAQEGWNAADSIRAAEAANSLDEISSERSDALSEYEARGRHLPVTGVTAIDAVLLYLNDRADFLRIKFQAEITAAPESIPETAGDRSEFIAVLADLCEYSFSSFASTDSNNAAVWVNVGQDNDRLFIEVSDNGKQFNMKELKKIGKKSSVPAEDRNGEKDYPLPLFRILRHSGAILSVNEFPQNENCTKSVRVTFHN